jgi:hypothetical protein
MSLKAVHLVFVVTATLLCFGLSVLYGLAFGRDGGWGTLGFGLGWLAGGVALVAYGWRVVRQFKALSAS